MSTKYSRSKWTKYKVMSRFEGLREHLPETRKLSQMDFEELIEKYGDIVVKPANGSRGVGVVRVSAAGTGAYIIHTEDVKTIARGKARAYNDVKTMIRTGSHIIQRRIPLPTVDGRPFDVRVIVQRKSISKDWKVTGTVAKVAGSGYFVTNNERSNGTVLPITTALEQSSFRQDSSGTLQKRIHRVALLSARSLCKSKLYSEQRIFGFDVGLDQSGHVWMIEVNLKPLLSHFRKLSDKTMYHRILAFKQRRRRLG